MSGSVIMEMMSTIENVARGFLDVFVDKCDTYSYNNDTIQQSTQATTTGSTTNVTTTTPAPAPVPKPTIIPILETPVDKIYCGEFKIRDKCLDATGKPTNGTKLQIFDCDESKEQKFQYTSKDNTIRLVSDKTRCLDIRGGNINDGSAIQIWDCVGVDAQKFIYDPVNKRIQSKVNTNKCIDLIGDNSDNRNNFQLLGCKDHRAQSFSANECTPNALESMASDLADGVAAVATSVGTSILNSLKFW